ncbi:MAG: S8 family peptidase [Mycobacteriales bacterium]
MLQRPAIRYRLANHVQGLPFDPPRWGEQPRTRPKKSLRQGLDTKVAVLDSGVSQHPWLAGSFAEDPLPEDALELWDLSKPALPRHVGHGTFVAGVILQYAPAARLLPRRVINIDGDADDFRLSAVIDALVDLDPDVVNLSLGPTLADEPGEVDEGTQRTVAALRRLQDVCGTVVVVAAGNSAEPFPADHIAPEDPLTVVVGALDLSGRPAWFSRKEPVQIWAPGVDILSSFVHFDGPVALNHPDPHEHHPAGGSHLQPNAEQTDAGPEHGGSTPATMQAQHPVAPFTGWARWNGTSFAAPAVAGALCAEISALAHIADRKQRRQQALAAVMDAARTLPDDVEGVALAAWPVALEGPPAW